MYFGEGLRAGRRTPHTTLRMRLYPVFYFKGRKSHKRVTWSDQFFRKGQRKVGTLAYEEMEGGGALGNVGGETGFGAAFRG